MRLHIGSPISMFNVRSHDQAVAEQTSATQSNSTEHGATENNTAPPAAPPQEAAQKRSLKSRLAGKLSGRQTAFTVGAPGTGRTINRPLRSELPETGDIAAGNDAEHDALLAEAHELNALARSMLKSQEPHDVSLWERPAPSRTRRLTTKVMPWLKPAPLRDVASTHSKGKPPAAPSQASDIPAPDTIASAGKELLGLVDHRRQELGAAVAAMVDARTHLDTLEHAASTAPLTPATRPGQELVASLREQITTAQARLSTAERNTRLANRQLRAVLRSTDLLHLTTLSENHDQASQRVEFSRQWLTDLKAKLQAVDVQLADRHTAIKLELDLKVGQTRELIAMNHDEIVAARAKLAAETRVDALRARLNETPAGTPERVALETEGLLAIRERIRARNEHQRILDSLEQVSADCAQLNDEISTLQQRLAEETRKRRVATSAPVMQAIDAQLQRTAPAAEQAGAAEQRPDKAVIDEINQRYLAHQIDTAQAFTTAKGTTAGLSEVQAALQSVGQKLSSATPATPMPAFTVMETITSALADVTGKDGKRAQRVLDALNQQPLKHWPEVAENLANTPHAVRSPSDAIARDAIELSRKLALLPRGMELLQLLSSEGNAPAAPADAKALRVFWNADQAQQEKPTAEVKAWLQSAKQVAKGKLGNDRTTFDDVDHAAYNAVRNGYFSNAPGSPYEQHDKRFKKATVEWVMRAVATKKPKAEGSADAPKKSPARRLVPNLNKTPFSKSTLGRSYDVGESMGMQSPRREVDQAVARKLSQLEATIAACRGVPGRSQDAAAAHAMVNHLRSLEKRGGNLSQVVLQERDIKAVRNHVTASAHEQRLAAKASATPDATGRRQPNVLMKARPIELPELYSQLGTGELSAYEGINRIEEQLRASLPAEQRPIANDNDDEDLAAAVRLLKKQHFSEKSDIVAFFTPFILDSRLRDRLRLGGGGTVGGGLPALPYGLISPIASPIFSAEMSRSDEAFTQLFMPILGMEMSFGKASTKAWEATGGVAVGPQLAPGISVQGAFTGRFAGQQTQTSSTLMRFFRTRHKDDEMRGNMLNALDSMVRWDVIAPKQGRQYSGPMEAILARNEEVSISQVDSTTDTRTLTARLAARLPSARFHDAHGASQTLSVEAAVYAEAERIKDMRVETGGFISVVGAKGDTAQQRAGVTTNLNVSPISNPSIPVGNGPHGGQSESLPLQVGLSRDLAWALEKNEISPFLLGDKQDADLDRHYSTPKDMLAEISANRDIWLMRGIETLEPDATGNKNTEDNRKRAAILLKEFETRIKELGEESNYSQYNVNYSMKGRVGAAIDGYRGIQELARQRGDAKGVERAQNAIDDILLMRGTWRPLMLIVRERARDSTTHGWRSLLRWQKISNVDGQRTAAQYPPP